MSKERVYEACGVGGCTDIDLEAGEEGSDTTLRDRVSEWCGLGVCC